LGEFPIGIRKISKSDLFGIFYVRKPDGRKWNSYYRTLETLRPLLEGEQCQEVVSGYYLNVCGNFDAVRISYFVSTESVKSAMSTFEQFFQKKDLVEIDNSRNPEKAVVAMNYGGEQYEERFRNYLFRETRIGLDIMKEDLLHAKALLATYRWQVRKASLPVEKHFKPTFEQFSPTFNSMSAEEREQIFIDLAEWPNPPQVDWAHMMVNFVLGCDWNAVFSDPHYLTAETPLSIQEINEIVRELDFQIPLGWTPEPR
jgi:hypothetical protein